MDEYDGYYDGTSGYDAADFYDTPWDSYDTYGDQLAVDGYESGALSEWQMSDEFAFDAQFQAFDDYINS